MILPTSPALLAATPSGSWHAWIQALKKSGKGGLPGRPDSAELAAPLPIWVDCHLSWYLDQPKNPKNALFSKIVLRAGAKVCQGQLEEWAL